MIRSSGPISILKTLFFLSIAALAPLIRPALPGNTALFDFAAAGFIAILGLWLMTQRRVSFRLAVPATLIFLASVIAMFNSRALGINILTLCQEIYLFAFFLTLYNIIDSERDVRILVSAWLFFAACEGAWVIRELIGSPSSRAQGTFDNPNMTASYLGLSLFMICLPYVNLRWWVGLGYLLLVGGGMIASKSLSALLATTVSVGMVTIFYVVKARDSRKLALVFGGLAVILFVACTAPWWLDMHNFLDRLPKSTDERTVIWKTGIDTFLSNPMGTGIGPGGFGEAGFVSGGYWGVGRRISLHSDYLSFLVERGVLGFAGLIIFLVAVALTARRCLRTARSEREMLWACGLIAMFLFILIDAGSHEVMHYRHVWLAFGLLAAQAKIQGRALAQSAPGWAFQRPELRPDLRPGLARPVPRLNRPAR